MVTVLGMRTKLIVRDNEKYLTINTCINNTNRVESKLSPFVIGPCELYDGMSSKNMENACKVYKRHLNTDGKPNDQYKLWAQNGWNNPKAVRYPMGRGAVPEYSWWRGEKLSYIAARKRIYASLYAKAITASGGLKWIRDTYQNCLQTDTRLILRDFDGHDHDKYDLSLTEVLNNPKRKMGHAFIIKALLVDDPMLTQIDI